MIKISKSTFIRLISFFIAISLALGVMAVKNYVEAENTKRSIKYGYLRAVGDLSLSLDNIKNALNKGLYSNSPEMLTELSGKLWSDASNAKISISQLPIDELNLENTYKFLSQVGNYSKALSKKFSEGQEITQEEKKNMETLLSYAQKVSDSLWSVESQIHGGYLSFDKAKASTLGATALSGEESPASVTNGFADIEQGFDNFPMLIYDGPFSDHIMQKDPIMLKGEEEIDENTALKRAVSLSGMENLKFTALESGRMPSYLFTAGNATVSITKNGGFLSYMLKYRDVGESKVKVEKSINIAKNYLSTLGILEITNTYFETQQGICIINFAATQDTVTLYTDLIKVGVALDNGEVVSFDARGYLTNHTKRDLPSPKISMGKAKGMLSPSLTPKESRLTVIPSDGMNEKYCYEFHCTTSTGQQILVYINAETGKEEQLLILKIDENGMLTV